PLTGLLKGANSLLPPDILIKQIDEVPENFHARFSAASRIYEYRIWNASQPSVFHRHYYWWIKKPLNLKSMKDAIAYLIGEHDFSSFRGSDHKNINSIREVKSATLQQKWPKLIFSIRANAFLRHMVRNIVGTLVEVGKGKISPKEFQEILNSCDRTRAGKTAPAHGLFLKEVCY
ncbi:MAG: tRNA pseudouridine synthase A, partial [Desulfobacterota bacterium]|nr:tRNA pseudouridine synthase A [Thermodesulfobacteriota bacterium]